MKFRYLGILGTCVGCFKTHAEARAFITSIPGMRGVILDRLLTPESSEVEDSAPLWRPVPIECGKREMSSDR
jgi:hypothetical protein